MADSPQPNKTEARAGVTLGTIRWVLVISVILAVIAMIAVYAGTPDNRVQGSAKSYGDQPDASGPPTREQPARSTSPP